MKFGESFVFPDPDSRLSHKPLKMVTVQSKPLVQNDTMAYLHVLSKSYRGKTLACDKFGPRKGRAMLKHELSTTLQRNEAKLFVW